MMPGLYLLALCGGIGCMLLIDWRYRLFFWSDAAAASLVTASGVAFFLLWDAAGIATGIFLRGEADLLVGIDLAPEFPLEEPVFLAFLVLCTMVLYTGFARLVENKRDRTGLRAPKGNQR